eukprot:3749848-Amphidinium_carterae.1
MGAGSGPEAQPIELRLLSVPRQIATLHLGSHPDVVGFGGVACAAEHETTSSSALVPGCETPCRISQEIGKQSVPFTKLN